MGIWKSVFSGKPPLEHPDFSVLGTDLHSHLIPGIDDGAASMQDSLEMVEGLVALGFKRIITTPHIMSDYFRNTVDTIQDGLDSLRKAVSDAAINITIDAAAEYMLDDGFEEKYKNGTLITFGDNYVLLELSTFTPYPNLNSILFDLQIAGYRAVLAHAERYTYWFDSISHYEQLKDREVLLQVNTLSFAGYYSPSLRKTSEKLADAGLIDLLGTDLHSQQSIPALEHALQEKYVQKLLGSGKLMNNSL